MRTFKITLLLLLVALLIFVANTLISTGFFRTIEPKFEGNIVKKVALPGAEDITISQSDSFAIVSATDRKARIQGRTVKGGLYFIDLRDQDFTPLPLTDNFNRPFAPHGISLFKMDSTYQVMAINHVRGKHSIEVFELKGKELTYLETLRDPAMIQPNDIIQVAKDRFYFTNDHRYTKGYRRMAEEYLGLAVSNVVYFDGKTYREVADGFAYANGINYDAARNLLYAAAPRGFLVKVFDVEADGSLSFIEEIDCGTGVDNIEFDTDGNLWIGAHPNLLRFTAYAQGKKETSPSEIIKIDYRGKGDYTVEKVYVENGEEMSGSTVAATFGNLILTGNVMDDAFLILERNEP